MSCYGCLVLIRGLQQKGGKESGAPNNTTFCGFARLARLAKWMVGLFCFGFWVFVFFFFLLKI